MYCSNCGQELLDDSSFCPFCGHAVEKDEPVDAEAVTPSDNPTPDENAPVEPAEGEADGAPAAGVADTMPDGADGGSVTQLFESSDGAWPGFEGQSTRVGTGGSNVASPVPGEAAFGGAPTQNVMPRDRHYGSTKVSGASRKRAGKKLHPVVITLVSCVGTLALAAVVFSVGRLVTQGGTQTTQSEGSSQTQLTTVQSQSSSSESTTTTSSSSTSSTESSNTTVSSSTSSTSSSSSADDYVLDDSSSHSYSRSELEGLDNHTLFLARNEVYARHGRIFKNEELQQYFGSKSWYQPSIQPDDFDESTLTSIERHNVTLMLSIEKARGSQYLTV